MPIPHPELVAAGADFIEQHTDAENRTHPALHHISEVKEVKGFDGLSRYDAIRITRHPSGHSSEGILDTPLFDYNTKDSKPPTVTNHPSVNTSDCSPAMLISLGNGIIEGRYPVVESLRETMLRRMGATLLCGATPRMLIDDIDSSIEPICKDDQQPTTYMASSELFFGFIANDQLPAFDVHDLVQHSAQIAKWKPAAKAIASAAFKAHSLPVQDKHEDLLLARKLTTFAWDTAFEESVLSDSGELYSFGCLNWFAPRDTPASRIGSISQLHNDEERLVHRWHYLNAIKDLYRRQDRVSKILCSKLNWMHELGYDSNRKFFELCASTNPAPFASMKLDDANELEITAPSTPEELMANAVRLIKKIGA